MNNNSSKQVLLSVIGVAILVVAVVGVSFAFFSFVQEGDANTLGTGTIVFNANQTKINLDNAFPTDATGAQTATVTVNGNTTYDGGIDYRVVVNTVTGGTGTIVPKVEVTAGQGKTGFTVEAVETTIAEDNVLVRGHINPNVEVNDTVLTIKAYYDKAQYHISNLENTPENIQKLKDLGLLDEGFTGQLITQAQWNALTDYVFTIDVIAVEGTAPAAGE